MWMRPEVPTVATYHIKWSAPNKIDWSLKELGNGALIDKILTQL
jgi:hypothetical protein